ncbi:Polyamine N-acetyltransferase [Lachnellula subtilissima]|uniref:Polyamine N-acetyltransferase n=1 Tax=Lachnellula subtilissima TaxID=602034 RepID=A0A8H8U8F5_9HELO|nr:Polyamine N-acetyltransferase [Lachnellula subtilissima]
MPQDLEPEREKDNKSPPITLTESPNRMASGSPISPTVNEPVLPTPGRNFTIIPLDQQVHVGAPTNLHPYTRPLTISDLESCVALENAAFTNPDERATREKFAYRLSKCGELCLGIFCTVDPKTDFKAETLATGKPIETSRKNGAISVLLGHVVAVKTNDPLATDGSMDYPKDWDSAHPQPSTVGHQEAGRTIVIHSVAILPGFQERGLGQTLTKAYVQQMSGAGIADKLALIAHDHKTQWYEKLGFVNKGKSKAQFGGGGWFDLVKSLAPLRADGT